MLTHTDCEELFLKTILMGGLLVSFVYKVIMTNGLIPKITEWQENFYISV